MVQAEPGRFEWAKFGEDICQLAANRCKSTHHQSSSKTHPVSCSSALRFPWSITNTTERQWQADSTRMYQVTTLIDVPWTTRKILSMQTTVIIIQNIQNGYNAKARISSIFWAFPVHLGEKRTATEKYRACNCLRCPQYIKYINR